MPSQRLAVRSSGRDRSIRRIDSLACRTPSAARDGRGVRRSGRRLRRQPARPPGRCGPDRDRRRPGWSRRWRCWDLTEHDRAVSGGSMASMRSSPTSRNGRTTVPWASPSAGWVCSGYPDPETEGTDARSSSSRVRLGINAPTRSRSWTSIWSIGLADAGDGNGGGGAAGATASSGASHEVAAPATVAVASPRCCAGNDSGNAQQRPTRPACVVGSGRGPRSRSSPPPLPSVPS